MSTLCDLKGSNFWNERCLHVTRFRITILAPSKYLPLISIPLSLSRDLFILVLLCSLKCHLIEMSAFQISSMILNINCPKFSCWFVTTISYLVRKYDYIPYLYCTNFDEISLQSIKIYTTCVCFFCKVWRH